MASLRSCWLAYDWCCRPGAGFMERHLLLRRRLCSIEVQIKWDIWFEAMFIRAVNWRTCSWGKFCFWQLVFSEEFCQCVFWRQLSLRWVIAWFLHWPWLDNLSRSFDEINFWLETFFGWVPMFAFWLIWVSLDFTHCDCFVEDHWHVFDLFVQLDQCLDEIQIFFYFLWCESHHLVGVELVQLLLDSFKTVPVFLFLSLPAVDFVEKIFKWHHLKSFQLFFQRRWQLFLNFFSNCKFSEVSHNESVAVLQVTALGCQPDNSVLDVVNVVDIAVVQLIFHFIDFGVNFFKFFQVGEDLVFLFFEVLFRIIRLCLKSASFLRI